MTFRVSVYRVNTRSVPSLERRTSIDRSVLTPRQVYSLCDGENLSIVRDRFVERRRLGGQNGRECVEGNTQAQQVVVRCVMKTLDCMRCRLGPFCCCLSVVRRALLSRLLSPIAVFFACKRCIYLATTKTSRQDSSPLTKRVRDKKRLFEIVATV